MKILIFTGVEFTFEKFILPLALNFKKEGYDVYTSFNKREYKRRQFDDYGFKFFYNPIQRKISLIQIFKSTIKLIKDCKNNNINFIHCHTPIASIVARLAGIFLINTKVIYTCHGFYFHENMSKFKFFIFFIIELFLSKITNKILFVSREDYYLAIKHKFKNKGDLIYISNGVSNSFSPIFNHNEKKLERSKYKIPNENYTFGIAARFVREKGFIELIHAFTQILKQFPNTSLCICGKRLNGEHNDDISNFIENSVRAFPENIFLIGEISTNNMPSFYKSLDAFILPSWREGMPMSILEAMMSGLPIIASEIRGCREAVKHNKNGILFNVKDVEALKQSMMLLVNDKFLNQTFGKKSREIALEEFTLKKNLRLQMDIFKNLN